MVAAIRFTAMRPTVTIRRGPTAQAEPLATLVEGDVIVAEHVFIEEGIEWVKLDRGAKAIRRNTSQENIPLGLTEDGFVPTEDPVEGMLLQKHLQVVVDERKEEGVLSKTEIREILENCAEPGMALPLEAKYWKRQQLEMFVMSGGVIRPAGCSMPDERLMANNNMDVDDVNRSLEQAARWLAEADALLVGSGAGMGVDSGLGTFRGGQKGVWAGLEAVGLAYEEICDPRWFREEPHLAWAFWDHCYRAYQETPPHEGYTLVRELGLRCPLGFFSFTSNIDNHWITSGAGADRVLEVHGAVKWLQCSKPCCPDVWKAPKELGLTALPTHRVSGRLPTCPKCKAVARPNVQMFGGDSGFSKARRAAQFSKYDAWLKRLEARPDKDELRIICLELGCGLTVPTVRKELETVIRKFPKASLVRVNLENPGVSHELARRGASLPLRAAPAIKELRQRADASQASFVLWGTEGAVELMAVKSSTLGQLLRRAGGSEGVTAPYTMDTKAVCWHGGKKNELGLEDVVPLACFLDTKMPDGNELRPLVSLEVDIKFLDEFGNIGANSLFKRRVEETRQMLDDMNALFADPSYQQDVKSCKDRRSVVKLARAVQFQVLPKYGIEATERGTAVLSHMTGIVQRIPEIGSRAAKSMDLSYIQHMHHLPTTEKQFNTSTQPLATTSPLAQLPPAEKTAQTRREAIATTRVKLLSRQPAEPGSDGDTFHIEVPTKCTIGELRKRLASSTALAWDDATLRAAEFAAIPGAGAMDISGCLQDSDSVQVELLVLGAPLRKPRELVEVTFYQMPTEDDGEGDKRSLKLRMFSDSTVADLKGILGDELRWDERSRRSVRFLFRLQGGSYGGLKDHERVEARRAIFVLGASLQAGPQSNGESHLAVAATPKSPSTPKESLSSASSPIVAPETAKAIAQAWCEARAAGAREEEGTWTRCLHYDLAGRDAEQMEATDVEVVRRRVELKGYVGFSLWMGKAYLKKADKAIGKNDLNFKGASNPVEFHLLTPNGPSGNAGLKLSKALALQAELMEGFAKPDFQRSLCELQKLHRGGKFQMERTRLCLTVQGDILPKYGFEGSLGGVMEMLEAFANPKIQTKSMQRNGDVIGDLLEGMPGKLAPQVH
mmetsp:Transcript_112716/g.291267  ORF Transcript_112716/g.291267 Transcript_112716/m.291267 type:complete len:1123 (+) Transcript_112716:151-3519(+)